MNVLQNIRFAIASLWANKGRSFLTMLGIIIGISAVVTLVSIGQGVKNDITSQITSIGSNLLFVVPGKIDTSGSAQMGSASQFIGGSILTETDLEDTRKIDGVEKATPLMLVSGILKRDGKQSPRAILIGTTPEMEDLTNFTVTEGRFLQQKDNLKGEGKNVIVLGKVPKEELFNHEDAIGKEVTIGQRQFEVIGIFEKPGTSNILGGEELQSFVTVPFETAKDIVGSTQIHRILVKVDENKDISHVAEKIKGKILDNHSGEEDFSVLTQEDLLNLLGTVLNLMTLLVSAIASISLMVGGIGIMNIMLVSVTERTREIGLRKAVGATSGAILGQFLIEAVILTFFGGLLGLAAAYFAINLIEAKSALQPILTIWAIGLAAGVSIGVGVIFGLLPAIRAARKNPIDALRYE